MRFEEFVASLDATGFGPGRRSRRWIDWPRVVAWSTVGILLAATVGGGLVATQLF